MVAGKDMPTTLSVKLIGPSPAIDANVRVKKPIRASGFNSIDIIINKMDHIVDCSVMLFIVGSNIGII